MMELFISGCAVFTSAIILKYHGEPRYRFAAAVLSVGGWVMAAAVALPEKWHSDQVNQKLRNIVSSQSQQVADDPQDAYLVGTTPGGNIVEIKSHGMRIGNTGSTERRTVPRWSWSGTGSSGGSVYTSDGTSGDGVTGSRGL